MREDCIVCEGNIHRTRHTTKTSKDCRSFKWVTCSHKCSRIYTKVYRFVYGRINRTNKGVKVEQIKEEEKEEK